MKNIIILAFALFASVVASAQKDNFTVKVEGLGCPFCAYGLEKKFKEVDGVKNIKIEIETGLMTFTADATKNLTIEKIDSQVDKAGYTAKEITIERANGKVETSAGKQTTASAGNKTETFKVYGNCTMCEARIEKAAKSLDGVAFADWKVESKMLTVKFDAKKVSLDDIHKKMAAVGHDTEKASADKSVYDNLPGCCHYDRKSSK
ncbi:MAG: heavy-metal-associated domain-containing protein [Saprospiraceae bacterium]